MDKISYVQMATVLFIYLKEEEEAKIILNRECRCVVSKVIRKTKAIIVYKGISNFKMSDDKELDRTLQKAILNLHDVKPKDPIRFLADYFTCECEDDPLATATNLFDSLTIFHPIVEERIIKCYEILCSSDEFEGVLVGARYNNFLKQLIKCLHVPSEFRKPVLDYLERDISSVTSCHMLRRAILIVLLYIQYFEEIHDIFDKLTISPDTAPTYRCEDVLIHASACLKTIHDNPKEYPYNLGISTFCDSDDKICQSSSKDSVHDEFWSKKDFMTAAKETFFREIDDLNLSGYRLFDHINYRHEDEHNEDDCESKHNENIFHENEHNEHENDKDDKKDPTASLPLPPL